MTQQEVYKTSQRGETDGCITETGFYGMYFFTSAVPIATHQCGSLYFLPKGHFSVRMQPNIELIDLIHI